MYPHCWGPWGPFLLASDHLSLSDGGSSPLAGITVRHIEDGKGSLRIWQHLLDCDIPVRQQIVHLGLSLLT